MKSYQRLLLFQLSVLLVTCLLNRWAVGFWNLNLEVLPAWEDYRYPFSRMFDRLLMITGIGCFFLWGSLLQAGSLAELGWGEFRRLYPDLVRGFQLAIGSVIMLSVLMTTAEVFSPYLRLSFAIGLERSVKALLAAVTVGILEEVFFRGLLLKGTLEDSRPGAATVATNLFYSAIHFVNPSDDLTHSGLDPLAGFRHVFYAFEPFLDPLSRLPGMFGPFLIGLVLSYAVMRTGRLYLSIGLHAGWIFALKTIRVHGDYRREDLGWLFGATDPKLVSGVASWLMLLVVAVIIYVMTRGREPPNEPGSS